jgi:hypothetical protein
MILSGPDTTKSIADLNFVNNTSNTWWHQTLRPTVEGDSLEWHGRPQFCSAAPPTAVFALNLNGNVGVGMHNPQEKLQVAGAIRSTATSPSFAALNGTIIDFNPGPREARIVSATTNNTGKLSFWTGSMANPAMYIDTNGWVRIGQSASSPTQQLHVEGNAYKTVGGNAWASSSDLRLKENIRPIGGALEKVLQLRGVTFFWKNPELEKVSPGPHMGLIGQEVEKVIPQWVQSDTNGYRLLTTEGADALLIEAIKELKVENETLKADLEALEQRMAKLEENR